MISMMVPSTLGFLLLALLTMQAESWRGDRAYEKTPTASSYANQFYGEGSDTAASYYRYKKNENFPDSYFKRTRASYRYKPDHSARKASSFINNEIKFHEDENNFSDESEEKIFSYDENDKYGPTKWDKINPQCNGQFQSPIAIEIFNTSGVKFSPALSFEGVDTKPSSLKVENNGHSMKISFNLPSEEQIKVSGGPLNNIYILDNAHWHWGRIDKSGSEHVVKGRRYSAELHLVFYNSQYGTFNAAAAKPKGLAVLGILYEVDNRQNGYINPWATLIHRVLNSKSSYEEHAETFSIRDLIKTVQFKYFTYEGSLTTPNCTENVTWMISSKPIPISSAELRELRKLRNEKGEQMFHNFRPLQFSKKKLSILFYAH